MAERLEGVAQRAVERATVTADDQALDVACGTGNASLLAAKRGARTVGVDFEPRLLTLAQERADAAGVEVEWKVGDAAALPVPDGQFTVVLSILGVMYAPDQAAAARELARVSAPGGRLGLVAWVPGSFMPAMGGALAPYLPPPPPGSAAPARWGDGSALSALLSSAGISLRETSRDYVVLDFADRSEAVEFLVRTAGHVLAERANLETEGRWQELVSALNGLVDERDEGAGGRVSLRLEYLLALGTFDP
ncbi:MAG TPA: class I SAM-dependent methyltransferase [Thermoleophilaceae bacterium]|nr:class I SAM-dependent methyltransferase [Thermoleophilaceae bacterium]